MTTEGHLPKWFGKVGQKQNERSRKQEREHARREGGRPQAGSGSSWRAPQDVKGDDFLDQLKFTDAKGYRVTAAECLGLLADAERNDRTGRLIIDFESHGVRVVGYVERIRA